MKYRVSQCCYIIFRGSVFDKIEEEEDEDEDEGESFKTDIEVDDRTYSVGNESSMNEGLRSRVKATFVFTQYYRKTFQHPIVEMAARVKMF